jgi:hypothetical protein
MSDLEGATGEKTMKTYAWDFVGPRSEAIARHHLAHVREFLGRERLEGCELGVNVESPMRAVAWCRAPDEAQSAIERGLRPPRQIS